MRERITVTIREDLLRSLDNMVDGNRIRNRSHALEYILARTATSGKTQAVILASGEGVKMRPFTYEIPKPLIPVHGKPLLEYTINLLREHGIKDIVITTHHLAEKIEKHFGDGSGFGVRIQYVNEKSLSGTGVSLWRAKEKLTASPFLLLYGDVLIDIDLTEFLSAHENTQSSSVATLALTSVANPTPYGSVRLRGTRIMDFKEKPDEDTGSSPLVFAGCAVLDQRIFDAYPKKLAKGLSLEEDIFPKLVKQGQLNGYPFEGTWFDVSTPEVYDQVLKSPIK